MYTTHDVHQHGRHRRLWRFVPLTLAFIGCGGRDVTGPIPAETMSTERVSYERKPRPGLQLFDFGELVVTEKLEPAVLPIPSTLDHNTEIIVKGTLRWPKAAGKIDMLRLEFFEPRQGVDVILQETLGVVKEKDGLYQFETELMTTPVNFVGKCQVRLWAYATPMDYDPSSGVPPKASSVVVGLTDVEMR